MDIEKGHLFLGDRIDPDSGDRRDDPIHYEASNFTTHGVIVGMTGSGKTGLSVVMLEEALLQGIPTLILDPKGDMGNLLLNFPDLDGKSFEPWVNEADADRDGISVSAHADGVATMWRDGLQSWGIDGTRMQQLRDKARFTIYTPGSNTGVPLNVIGDLKAPADPADEETLQDEVEGLVSSLLGLIGVESDPISGREHILLANLVHNAWTNGQDLDLAALLGQIQNPPMRKLGVIEIDTFFPPEDRVALAMKLNGLMASPSFASWTVGADLDIDELLYGGGGGPNAAIISLSHLSDEERQFVVTLVLSKVVTWMRGQSGTPELRALIYMDEVFGFVPPTAQPPSKKPILTILKQARAFGVGLVLSTQNPVDIDYKAISNAGTWMIGRLQTEQDKARLLEGLSSAGGSTDIGAIDNLISSLGKRKFLLHSTKSDTPDVFTTRWAMSYLPGPLTRDQIADLTPADAREAATAEPAATDPAAPSATSAPAASTEPDLADDETAIAPEVPEGIPVRYLDAAAPWGREIGAVPSGNRHEAALVARVKMVFDEDKADLRHEAEWEAVLHPLGELPDADAAVAVDYDVRDLRTEVPDRVAYVKPAAPIHTKTYFTKAQSELKNHLYRSERVTLFQNAGLKLYSRIGETEAEFSRRCDQVAEDRMDDEADELRTAIAKKQDRVEAAIQKAEDAVRETEQAESGRKKDEFLSGAVDLVGGLLSGKSGLKGLLGIGKRASSKRRMSGAAAERVKTAKNRLEEKVEDLEELQDELIDALSDIEEKWEDIAAEVTSLEVGLEKTDIAIDEIALVWFPTA